MAVSCTPAAVSLRDLAYAETVASQRAAADPAASAWVSANAGAGKTHVLVARLVRLLLAGTAPERILCLTFTKAAAAEMATRVFARLSRWVTMEDGALAADLAELNGRDPSAEELVRARDLFAVAMETPGGLKVQTIHAFCERLLQRFPLEAGVPPEFAVLDDETRRTTLREARDGVLMAAVAEPDGALGRAHTLVVGWAAEEGFDRVLADAMRRRECLAEIDRQGGIRAHEGLLRTALGVGAGATVDGLTEALANALPRSALTRAQRALAGGTSADVRMAGVLSAALASTVPSERIKLLRSFFLTDKGGLRDRLVTKAVAEGNSGLKEELEAARDRFARLWQERIALLAVEASLALTVLAAAVSQRYAELKRARAALDFDDLIGHAASLVADRQAADWVLYKLDGGLDHILIDEAQDTSPGQWRLVEALAREFFAGHGAREDTAAPRTVFAVGDEKQSIYGFQGAEPRLFAAKGAELRGYATGAGGAWRGIPLTLSFRSVSPVLEAVDRIFADPDRTRGVDPAAGGARVKHSSNRPGSAGLVEIWEPETASPADAGDAWDTSAVAAERPPAERVAERIAGQIRRWLDGGEMLASEARPVRAGDILILVRKRVPFAPAMVAALERHGVPVAGADRMVLTGQLAVQDLIVLCRFLLLPEDDLSLATVLVSPFFGLDDDDLIRLAPGRKGSLWQALLAAAGHEPRYAAVAAQLKRWRARADLVPPFELLVEILDHDGMRGKLVARLGTEAADAIDELVSRAIAHDEDATPSLEGFVHALMASQHEIKRDMEHGRDEVRVMTVHGAKGLEAPIVFLPDTCSAGSAVRGLVDIEAAPRRPGLPAPFVWAVPGTSGLPAIAAARDGVRAREEAESHRLLYVALTRARDRLYIAGFHRTRAPPGGCWYDLVTRGLADLPVARDDEGRSVRRLAAAQTADAEAARAASRAAVAAEEPPEWARRRAPAEPTRLVPLTPSRLAPLDTDAEGEPVQRLRSGGGEPAAPSPLAAAGEHRFLRGTVTHALLEHLPGLDPGAWEASARAFVAARAAALPRRTRDAIVAETLAILRAPEFAPLFGPQSRAEVSIVAELAPPPGKATSVRLTGQIDRLVELDDRILVVDYKTNRPPPSELPQVPDAYVLQLAAYRLALAQVFPGLPVHAALLWTDGPRIMAIPPAMLDAAEPRLFAPELSGQE